jgi:hypothetical protein
MLILTFAGKVCFVIRQCWFLLHYYVHFIFLCSHYKNEKGPLAAASALEYLLR